MPAATVLPRKTSIHKFIRLESRRERDRIPIQQCQGAISLSESGHKIGICALGLCGVCHIVRKAILSNKQHQIRLHIYACIAWGLVAFGTSNNSICYYCNQTLP